MLMSRRKVLGRRIALGLLFVMGLALVAEARQQPGFGPRPARRPSARSGYVFHSRFGDFEPAQSDISQRSNIAIRPYNVMTPRANPAGPTLPSDIPRFQNDSPRPIVARFGEGGGPTRAEQMEALQIGVSRANSLQNQLNALARPYMGFGYW
jgi:hypothetical protein